MTVTSTRQPEVGGVTNPTELLIREARAASRRRRQRVLAVVFCVLVVTVAGFLAIGNSGPPRQVNTPVNTEPRSLGIAKTSPYPRHYGCGTECTKEALTFPLRVGEDSSRRAVAMDQH